MIGVPHLRNAAPDADAKQAAPQQGDGGEFDATLSAASRGTAKQGEKPAANTVTEGDAPGGKGSDASGKPAAQDPLNRNAASPTRPGNDGPNAPAAQSAAHPKTTATPAARATAAAQPQQSLSSQGTVPATSEPGVTTRSTPSESVGSTRALGAQDSAATGRSGAAEAGGWQRGQGSADPQINASAERWSSPGGASQSAGEAEQPATINNRPEQAVPVRHALSLAHTGVAQGAGTDPQTTTGVTDAFAQTATAASSLHKGVNGGAKPAPGAADGNGQTGPQAAPKHPAQGAIVPNGTASQDAQSIAKPDLPVAGLSTVAAGNAAGQSDTPATPIRAAGSSATQPHQASHFAGSDNPSLDPDPIRIAPPADAATEAVEQRTAAERGDGRGSQDQPLPGAMAATTPAAPGPAQPATPPQADLAQRAMPQNQAQPLASDPKPTVRQVAHVVRQETHFAPVLPTPSTNAAIQTVPANIGLAAAAAAAGEADGNSTSRGPVLERARSSTGLSTALSAGAMVDGLGNLEQAAAIVSQMRSAVIANLAALPLSADLVRSEAAERQRAADAMQTGQNTTARSTGPVRVLELSMQPASLGSVTVRLRLSSDGLSVDISASDPSALEALEGGEDTLRAALSGAGYATSTLTVSRATPDKAFFAPISDIARTEPELDPSGMLRL